MKSALCCLLSLMLLAGRQSMAQCSIERPAPAVTTIASCKISMAWNAVSGAAYYKVRYKINGTSTWTNISEQVTSTEYTFDQLATNTKYKLSVAAYCSDNTGSGYKNITETTAKVSVPESVAASPFDNGTVTISWVATCNTNSFNLQYKESSGSSWTLISGITSSSFAVIGLEADNSYDFEVQGKHAGYLSAWSPRVTVNTSVPSLPPSKPNIIVYLMDDARYDPFQPNGGPEWFSTPTISRLAAEGVNFKYAFPTTSQCAPSRVSIYTGLYASKHGAVDNSTRHNGLYPFICDIMKQAGYYTGLIGKYGNSQGSPTGWDWWATSAGDNFINTDYKINNVDTMIAGHITDVYEDLAFTFFDSVPEGQPFMLFFNTRLPHTPTVPRDEDLTLYMDETMPLPQNFSGYTENYPSYFYATGSDHEWNLTEQETQENKRQVYQSLYGAEVNMTTLFNWLTDRGILDSTIIIFTSDNGYLEGEHKLVAKQIAQEESIRLPLIVRYPAWFAPGTVNASTMASNVDITLTLLDAAGIPDTFGMDGVSLRQLNNNEVTRKYFYYQFSGDGSTPSIRAVRSLDHKFVKHYCNQVTEEFYDLVNDPYENVNQINNENFAALVSTYRLALDSIRNALGDPVPTNTSCFLSNPQFQRLNEGVEETIVQSLAVYPNPASDFFNVEFRDEEREHIRMWVTNLLQVPVYYKEFPNTNALQLELDTRDWVSGNYFVHIRKGGKNYSTQLSVQ